MNVTAADYKRRLTAEQRSLIDSWLEWAGIEKATRIRRGKFGRTIVTAIVKGVEVRMVVADPPFPWSEVLQQPD